MPHGPRNYTDIHNLISRSQRLVSWRSPMRPYRKKSRYLIRFFIALALILSSIVFFFGDLILMVPIWAVLFLFYVLSITPPPTVDHKITKFGVETAGIQIRWEALAYFYFSERMGYEILTIVTHPPHNMHIYMIVPDDTIKEKAAYLLSEKISYLEDPPVTLTDRLINLFHVLVPEDEEEDPNQSRPSKPSSDKTTQSDQQQSAAVAQTQQPASPVPQTSVTR